MQTTFIGIISAAILLVGGYFFFMAQPAQSPATDDAVMMEGQSGQSDDGAMEKDGEAMESHDADDAMEKEDDGDAMKVDVDAEFEATHETGDTGAAHNTYTMAEVATHNSAASCYTVIRGMVYDLTAWIAKHPGGENNILKLCGIDGTTSFERKHGGKDNPENTLAGFEIGVLAQ